MMGMVDVVELAFGAFAIGAAVGAFGVLGSIAWMSRKRADKERRR